MSADFAAVFNRYRPVIDDWEAFCGAMARPLPRRLRVNSCRCSNHALTDLLIGEDLACQPLAWDPQAVTLSTETPLGGRWWYRAGLAHAQEAASMLPAKILDPAPGERVLDLCAAPGGKTAQLAQAVGPNGTVVANDPSPGRHKALRANLDRLGLINVTTTRWDGSRFPDRDASYDKILVDAPCSGEGRWRQFENGGFRALERPQALQQALLRRAVALCRPGGHIAYSTCTFAPEENEAVVDALLRQHPEMRLVRPAMEGVRASGGVTAWRGRRFHPSLEKAWRIWPHQNDSGGFFLALMVKAGDEAPAPRAMPPRPTPETGLHGELQRRYGLAPSLLADHPGHRQSRRGWHLVGRGHRAPQNPPPEVSGVFAYRTNVDPPKLSTAGAMILGGGAERNVVDLQAPQLADYLARRRVAVDGTQGGMLEGTGYVIVRYRGVTLGTAWHRHGDGYLRSLYPKSGAAL